jgi:hypothetical protein
MLAGLGVRGDGAPVVSRSGGLEADGDAAKQCVVRACCCKGDADACGGLGDACGDFEEARPKGGELGVGERMRLVDGVAHRQHQPVGGERSSDFLASDGWKPERLSRIVVHGGCGSV